MVLADTKSPSTMPHTGYYQRPLTKSGGRNMQDSSLTFGDDRAEDQHFVSSIRVKNPPGGKSSIF